MLTGLTDPLVETPGLGSIWLGKYIVDLEPQGVSTMLRWIALQLGVKARRGLFRWWRGVFIGHQVPYHLVRHKFTDTCTF